MSEKMKARSACQRSRALGVVFAGAINNAEIAANTAEIQSAAVGRYGVSPATQRVIAELAFAVPEHWRRG